MHTFAGDDTRRHHFDPAKILGINRTFTIQRLADCRDNPAKHGFTNRYLGNLAGSFDHIAFFNVDIFAHDGATDIVLFKVQHQPQNTARKLDKLQSHDLLEAVNTCDTVTNRQNDAGFAQLDFFVIIRNLFFNNLTDFFCS